MASVTTIKYFKEGTSPPIFLAGSFSDWEPQEMEHEEKDGEHFFYKNIKVDEGKEVQYKFRIGHGDWWVLDETAPVVTDNAGNRNNLLVIPPKSESSMIDQIVSQDREEHLANMQQVDPVSEKDMSEAISQPDEIVNPEPTIAEVSKLAEKIGEEEKNQKTTEEVQEKIEMSPSTSIKVQSPTMSEAVPTLTLEKTDALPSNGKDFDPQETVANNDAQQDRPAIHLEEGASQEAETIAEVFESAALLDEREKTPDIPDEEAGKIGFRRMSSTPIPEVASTAAEVADSAAILDDCSVTPELSDTEAGKIGLRRMSTTPIAEVSNTAAEVADSAATLDLEDSGIPDLNDEEAGKIGLRRLSTTPISIVAETAAEVAEVAASLDRPSLTRIDIPATHMFGVDDDDDVEYPITPAHEKAPLLSHERFIPGNGISPPTSPTYLPEPSSDSPGTYPWGGRVSSFPYDRHTEHGSRNSPRSTGRIPTPEAESQFQLHEFPTTRAGILALIEETQRNLPEDEVRVDSPSSPSGSLSHQFGRPEVLTPGVSPERGLDHRMSLDCITEEDDSATIEDTENLSENKEMAEDAADLIATQSAQISDLTEHPTEPEQTLEALKTANQALENNTQVELDQTLVQPEQESVDQDLEKEIQLKHDQVLAQPEQEFVQVFDEAAGEAVEEIFSQELTSHDLEQELEKKSPEFQDKTVEGDNRVCETKQVAGNNTSEQVTPAEPTSEYKEAGDEVVSDDTPQTTPPTSRDGNELDFHVTIPDTPAIVIHPATPGPSTMEMGDSGSEEEEARIEAQAPEPLSTPMLDKIEASTSETFPIVIGSKIDGTSLAQKESIEEEASKEVHNSAFNDKAKPVPEEVKVHVHTKEQDIIIASTPESTSEISSMAFPSKANSAQEVPVEINAGEEAHDSEYETRDLPVPEQVKTHVHMQQEDTGVESKTVSQEASIAKSSGQDTLSTENTITRRKPGRSSVESGSQASIHGSASLLTTRHEQEHPGFFVAIYSAVMGWIGGIFSSLCDGGRAKDKKAKDKKKKVVLGGGESVKTVVVGATAGVILVVGFWKLFWGSM